ncbi:MAG TPA: amino acid adenylation domain-containing protein [Mycobacterium sp.]|nr:amino acid adenylation domain-containing protein [Mycobacterium sp.]
MIAVGDEAILRVEETNDLIALGCGGPLPAGEFLTVQQSVANFTCTTPAAAAVISGGASLTYGELDAWARGIAALLSARGVRHGDHVGVLVEPSPAMVAAVLGVLQAGAAYVPVSILQPRRRIAEILRDARVSAVVVADDAGAAVADLDLPIIDATDAAVAAPCATPPTTCVPVEATDPAYLIYTSGTTGEPKGVVVEHGQLAASTLARRCVYPGAPIFLLVSPLAFDSSVAGLWGTLTSGGCLVVAARGEVQDPERLIRLVAAHRVTHLLCVPALYESLLRTAERLDTAELSTLRTVTVAGEQLAQQVVERHFRLFPVSVTLVNEYGPTETTVWASYHRFEGLGPVTIGRPIPGARLYVLDDELRPVRRGERGELFVAGAGVARGYFGRPEATARAFLDDPFAPTAGARMYRTGDVVRWNAAGTLDFIGRRDQQVKIRGCRVELGVVAATLRSLAGVRDAAVVADREQASLTGFVLASPEIGAHSLREQLKDQLPAAMVPDHIRVVDRLPRTMNGKVDAAALCAVAQDNRTSGTPSADAGVPDPDCTAQVAAAWSEVLKVPAVPTNANFFDIGGHSLAMFRLQEALERHTGTRPPVVALFQHTTVSAQALLIRDGVAEEETARADKRRAVAARLRAARAGRGRHVPSPPAEVPDPRSLRCVVPCPDPQYRLVCFPHAGGSPAFFRDWGNHLPRIEVQAVCYPGRAERLEEPPPTDLRSLAQTIAVAITELDDLPLALFGHSMGAVIALETARSLEARGVRVLHLFASGSRDADDGSADHEPLDGHEAVPDRLVELGGTDPELAAAPLFQELVLPDVRSDSHMFHAYHREPGPLLRCPVTSIVGDCDRDADRRPWRTLTIGGFQQARVPGDHFYLISAPPYGLVQNVLTPGADQRELTEI